MAQDSTLRIGPAGPLSGQELSSSATTEPAASVLKSALLKHFCASASATSDVITIDNKYFAASVALSDLDLHPSSTDSNDAARKEDGLILVFHDTSTSTATVAAPLDALASVHSAAESSDQAGDLLRLLVAVTVGPVPEKSTKAAEEEYSRRVLWCLDRGYEYVEADCSNEGIKLGHDHREKDGFARVVEAVGGTVWSCAVNKPRGGRAVAAKAQGTAASRPAVENAAASAAASQEPTKASNAKESFPTSAFSLPAEPDITEDDNEESDRFVFDNLEKVMSEAARIRSQAKNGELTDEERRTRASDAAVALMGVMERMGFDDDSSEDGENGSSQGGSEGEKEEVK